MDKDTYAFIQESKERRNPSPQLCVYTLDAHACQNWAKGQPWEEQGDVEPKQDFSQRYPMEKPVYAFPMGIFSGMFLLWLIVCGILAWILMLR